MLATMMQFMQMAMQNKAGSDGTSAGEIPGLQIFGRQRRSGAEAEKPPDMPPASEHAESEAHDTDEEDDDEEAGGSRKRPSAATTLRSMVHAAGLKPGPMKAKAKAKGKAKAKAHPKAKAKASAKAKSKGKGDVAYKKAYDETYKKTKGTHAYRLERAQRAGQRARRLA